MTSQSEQWLTLAEACSYLKITRATVYRWAREGRLHLYKLGGRTTRLRRADLDNLARDKGEEAGWLALSQDAFAAEWDNDQDAVYDQWREIYGIPKG